MHNLSKSHTADKQCVSKAIPVEMAGFLHHETVGYELCPEGSDFNVDSIADNVPSQNPAPGTLTESPDNTAILT